MSYPYEPAPDVPAEETPAPAPVQPEEAPPPVPDVPATPPPAAPAPSNLDRLKGRFGGALEDELAAILDRLDALEGHE